MHPAPAVHRVFGITELLGEVVRHVAQDSLHDTASLCVTNRLFHNVAQNELWRSLGSLHPLLGCFSEECLEYDSCDSSDNPHPRRAPLPAEWERFLDAASRVRSLKHHVSEDDISNEVFDVIAIYRPRLLLLPNIEHLEWLDDENQTTDISMHALLFLGPRLRSLELTKIQFASHWGVTAFTNITALLKTIHHMGCRLDSLKVSLDQVASEEVSIATAALVLANNLKEFLGQYIRLPNDAIVHLAGLPSLITAGISLQTGATFERLDGPLFPAVEYMHVSLDDLAEWPCRRLITNIASPRLGTLGVTFRREPNQNALHSLVDELAKSQHAAQLHTLHLVQDSARYKTLEDQVPDRPDLVINCVTLLPMLSIRNLVDIEISSPYVDLDDYTLITIIESFPLLRRLYFNPGYYSGRAPKTTLKSVVTAASRLPRLQELGFPVDVSTESVHTVNQFSIVNWTCTRLHVADSPLSHDQIHSIAQFLYSWFRHVELCITTLRPDVPGDLAHADQRAIYAANWEQCNRIMHPWKWWTDEVTAHLATETY
ncbi:hypothetical protein PHLGIDRAFT_141349 [Phlebiopsis gigantea 11061_1 CR5-6]|uniref:F-box domain-containing protein n=1 Tax=Phlebiopsis gigantea (strain 11061_1 CR5-6) TaxID=745531 RepID=A0A0C3P0M5_PHLG1|nr:hypothetical protein PHLGIDRAFT_141349 [Phlebiopsis gigantea 11061_1 CR5-6]